MGQRQQGGTEQGGESMVTVLLALGVNLGIAVIKAVAGLLTASAGLLAEAAHSLADSTTEVLLITALRRSRKPADERHPFGYGKERYFWSLLASLGILAIGAGFSFYQGIHTLANGEEAGPVLVAYAVIAISIVAESISFVQGIRQVRKEAARTEVGKTAYLREPEDPTVKSIVLEDSAAIVGLLLALAGLVLRQVTGSAMWDGIAAIAIGALLAVVAVELVRTNVGLLIGKQANPKVVEDLRRRLAEQPEVLEIVDVLTMMLGTGKILLCARIDLVEEMSGNDVERACVEIHYRLRDEFPDLEEVFLEPVPRDDPRLREEALNRKRVTAADGG